MVPNFIASIVPFPFSLFVHEGMPFLVAKIPCGSLTLLFDGMLYRDTCDPSNMSEYCKTVRYMDQATLNVSHEYVESVTDPFSTLGWYDISKLEQGEIADICKFVRPWWGERTRAGSSVLATYWSNAAMACVPGSRPSITIYEPQNGENVHWAKGGATAYLGASAADPVDGALTNIVWSVDGRTLTGPFASGPHATASSLSQGTHIITASATDSQTLTATAGVSINITALGPVASITSPPNGAVFAANDPIVFRGFGFDYQDGALLDPALIWTANVTKFGSGKQVIKKIGTPGNVTILLSVINSAGLTATDSRTIHITPAQAKPTLVILEPPDGSAFRYSTDQIGFIVDANTVAGNYAPQNWIQWSSDVDGFLGIGHDLPHTLSGGACGITVHHITATITDPSSGNGMSDTIVVYVGQIC